MTCTENHIPLNVKDTPTMSMLSICKKKTRLVLYNLYNFLQCTWEGVKCDPDDFQEIVADMGICYAFNAGSSESNSVF